MVFSNQRYSGTRLGMSGLAAAGRMYAPTLKSRPFTARRTTDKAMQGMTMTVRGGNRKRLKPNSFHAKLLKNETCQHAYIADVNATISPLNFTHNTIWTIGPSQAVGQGTTEAGRIGNTVYMEALKVNAFFSGPAATNNGIQLRIITFYLDTRFPSLGGSTWVAGAGLADLFGSQSTISTGISNTSSAIVDPKKITVLDDRMYAVNPQIAAAQDTIVIEYTVDLKNHFDYVPASPNSLFGKTKNLYQIIVPSIVGGATGTTSCGTYSSNFDLLFRNSK